MEKAVKYGEMAGAVALVCVRRRGLVDDNCPASYVRDDEEQQKTVKEIAAASKRLVQICNEQRAMELAGGDGIITLLGHDVPDSVRVAVNLLVANAFVDSLRTFVGTVSELAEMATARDPKGLIEVREAFGVGGDLRPHVNVLIGRHIGELERPALKEKSLRVIMGLPLAPAAEFEAIEAGAQVAAEFSKWRRYR